jgi:hypothetical protein
MSPVNSSVVILREGTTVPPCTRLDSLSRSTFYLDAGGSPVNGSLEMLHGSRDAARILL